MPVPSIRPPGWRLEGTDELENRPNGPKDYNPHDYRDWKQQIAEYEAEGISRPGAILEKYAGRGLERTHMPVAKVSHDGKYVNVTCGFKPDSRLDQFVEFIYCKCGGDFVKTVRLCLVHEPKMHIHREDFPEGEDVARGAYFFLGGRGAATSAAPAQVIELFAISTDVGVWTTGPIKISALEREPPAPPKEF